MAVMIVIILCAFAVVVAVVYFGAKENLAAEEHLTPDNSLAVKVWSERAAVAEAARTALVVTQAKASDENTSEEEDEEARKARKRAEAQARRQARDEKQAEG